MMFDEFQSRYQNNTDDLSDVQFIAHSALMMIGHMTGKNIAHQNISNLKIEMSSRLQ